MKEPIIKKYCDCCDLKRGCSTYIGFILICSIFELFKTIGNLVKGRHDYEYGFGNSDSLKRKFKY